MKLCECGCGSSVRVRFLPGHNTRKHRVAQLCECRCGEFAKLGRRFIRGHQRRGAICSEEQRQKLCGKIPWNKGIPRTSVEIEAIKAGQTVEGKQRISDNIKKRWADGITGSMRSLYGETNPSKRPEVRKKISEASLGKVISNVTRLKISLANKGKPGLPWSKSQRAAASDRMKTNNPMVNLQSIRKMVNTSRNKGCYKISGERLKSLHAEGRISRVPMTEEMKAIHKNRMLVNNPMKNPEIVEKVSAQAREDYKSGKRKSPHLYKYGLGRHSDGQEALYNILNSIGVEYQKEYSFMADSDCPNKYRLYVDAAILSSKIIIEYDGWPYHQFKRVQENDRKRDSWLRGKGWGIIRIVGDEVQDADYVRKTIQGVLNK